MGLKENKQFKKKQGKTTIHPDEELKEGEMFEPLDDDELFKKTGTGKGGNNKSTGGKKVIGTGGGVNAKIKGGKKKKAAPGADDNIAIFDYDAFDHYQNS